jgi:hypothetical protein
VAQQPSRVSDRRPGTASAAARSTRAPG